MGFRPGAYAKIWSVDPHDNYTVGNLSISKKKQDGEGYVTEFQNNYVKFVKQAHPALSGVEIPKNGLSVQLVATDVFNKYDAEKKAVYTDYIVYEIEIQNNGEGGGKPASGAAAKPKSGGKAKEDASAADDELPF